MLDSDYSPHMTKEWEEFTSLKLKGLRAVPFGSNDKFKVLGLGNIELDSNFIICKVLFDENLNFNQLNISQLYDTTYQEDFDSTKYLVKHTRIPSIILI